MTQIAEQSTWRISANTGPTDLFLAHNRHPLSFAIHLWPYFSKIYSFLETGWSIELKRTVHAFYQNFRHSECGDLQPLERNLPMSY